MASDDSYMGSVDVWAPNFAPRGWAFCAGQMLSINQYTAVFALVGTTYGGDGRNTFGVPDLRGRVPVGVGTGPGLTPVHLGGLGGYERVGLTTDQMPAHNHPVQEDLAVSLKVSTSNADSTTPDTNHVLGKAENKVYTPVASANTQLSGAHLTGTITTGSVGSGSPHENRQPYLGLNYIFCLEGLFPPRN